MKIFKLLMIFAFLISLTAFTASAQETINLTIPLPLTGAQALFGEVEKRSYEIAMQEINAAGGIKGKKVVLEFADSQGKPGISISIARQLVEIKKQPVIFGEYSSACSKAVAALAEEKKIPYLVVTAAADEITQRNYRYVYRMNPPNARYPSGLISFLKNVVKPETVAIIYEDSEFGTSGANDFAREAEKAGITVMLKQPYSREPVEFFQPDFAYIPDLKVNFIDVKAAMPDVIYMVSYERDAVQLIKQIKKQKVNAKLISGGAAGFAVPRFIRDAGDASEYLVTTSLWRPGSAYPGAIAFAEKYKNRYGEYPSYHGAEAYSALFIIKNVLERSKTWKAEDIRAAMEKTNMMTAFGPIKFEDKEGYTNQNFMDTIVMQVINKKFEVIWPERLATKKYVYPIPRWSERK